MEAFKIKVVGEPLTFRIEKKLGMICRQALFEIGLDGYELLVEPDDFRIFPDECIDFIGNNETLFARPAT
jgi:hypothetical protein